MCNFCKAGQKLNTEWDCLRVQIVGNGMEIGYEAYSTDSSFSTVVRINYCAMCGEKIETSGTGKPVIFYPENNS